MLRYSAATAWMTSAALHAIGFAGLGAVGTNVVATQAPATVEFRVLAPTETPRPEPPPEVEVPEPEYNPVSSKPEPHAPPTAVPEGAPKSVEVESAPLDLTGVTLTNGSGEGAWASALGNGAPLSSAFGISGAPAVVSAAEPPRPSPPRDDFVAAGDLSKPPVAPNLDGVLAGLYPPDARRRGIAGQSVVRVRIAPSGSVARVSTVSESGPGFADACRRALRASVWSAPRDRHGRAVSTEVKYVCRFQVDD